MENLTSVPFSNRDSGSAFMSQYHFSGESAVLPFAVDSAVSLPFAFVTFEGGLVSAFTFEVEAEADVGF